MSRLYHAYREHYHAEVRCCTAVACHLLGDEVLSQTEP